VSDFVDSNVLIYCLLDGDARFETALGILGERPVTSVQVLNEMVSVARSKYRIDWPRLNAAVDLVAKAVTEIHPLLPADNREARRLAERYKLQWWDALIVATALRTGAARLLTEDMQHGQLIEGRLRVVNPFMAG
jgi:predicted nucleic acid-binding protein